MADQLASSLTRIATAFRALFPDLIQRWVSSASSSSAGSAAIPGFSLIQNELQPSITALSTQFADTLSVEGGSAREACGLELRRYLADRIIDEYESTDSAHLLNVICASSDIALISAHAGIIDLPVAFGLIEEAAEMLPTPACADLWTYAEVRRPLLTEGLNPIKGTALTILRTSNDLLRRISKPDLADATLGGRVLGYVAEVFPLDDKGGRNSTGDFNTSNVTKFEPRAAKARQDRTRTDGSETAEGEDDNAASPGAEEDEGTDDQEEEDSNDGIFPPNFYEDFWTLQNFFSNPKTLAEPHIRARSKNGDGTGSVTEPNSLKYFHDLTDIVLGVFKKIQEKETADFEDTRGSSGRDSSSTTALAPNGHSHSSASSDVLMDEQGKAPSAASFLQALPWPSATLDSNSTGRKRKREDSAEADVLSKAARSNKKRGQPRRAAEPEAASASASIAEEAGDDHLFTPKYLTGRKLLKYEYFVLLQYILSWTGGDEKWGPEKVKIPSLQRPLQLSNDDNTQIRRQLWITVSGLTRQLRPDLVVEPVGPTFLLASDLKESSSNGVAPLYSLGTTTNKRELGPDFMRVANQILRREQHWVNWKMAGCNPSIERTWANIGKDPQATKAAASADAGAEERKKALNEAKSKLLATLNKDQGPPGVWDHALGTAALTRLWERGFPPPAKGLQVVENDEGVEETRETDGLEPFERQIRYLPTLEEMAERVRSTDQGAKERREEKRKEMIEAKKEDWREAQEKKKREAAARKAKEEAEKEELKKPEEGELESGEVEEAAKQDPAEADADVEMTDAEEKKEEKKDADSNGDAGAQGTENSKVESTPAPEAESAPEPEPEHTVDDEELKQGLLNDEEYSYRDESRLHASWKYLRLARNTTVPHWANLTPATVIEVLKREKEAEEKRARTNTAAGSEEVDTPPPGVDGEGPNGTVTEKATNDSSGEAAKDLSPSEVTSIPADEGKIVESAAEEAGQNTEKKD
ncbi:hypothetical protein OC846_000418 [Tilletia horrida]|uniref:THO complex subunit 1 transcription elongation factor-domain-containing protein n=1 Tax=Tilletia horrida TaxID=155126 RepID=A0AAN6H0Q2_9BASI|nr:hypothetical protein OC845_001060 [Tilletia horrida]KAK0557430.1 hypothetical protein OC846_000418 [Tilletia horrida]KAK0569534.1 hypothetical protein OC861_000803 [Tilletia horrida]